MKNKSVITVLLAILIIVGGKTPCTAHTSSLSETLGAFYDAFNYTYYIGGEDVGWIVDEHHHSYPSYIEYIVDIDASETDLINYIEEAAEMWLVANIVISPSSGGRGGTIIIENVGNMNAIASVEINGTDANGHIISWTMRINPNKINQCTPAVIAHEFGHVIGLRDLYDHDNIDKLMHGSSDVATAPTEYDIWGAKVITGQHTTHSWEYSYYGTSSQGNTHIGQCTDCNGYSASVESCTYRATGTIRRCLKCGIPEGYQPYGADNSKIA